MATKHLKGLTIQIGADTSGLDKALSSVDKKSRSLSSELGQINKLLKLDPTNTELLAQKQKVLADAISNTESRLDTLREAEKQVQAQFERGEVSEEQYRALQREIIATEGALAKYKNAAKETAEAAEKLADAASESAEELEETAESAEDANKATDDLGDTLSNVAKTGFTALIGAATAAVTAVVGLAESTREYRREMGKLDTAFQDAGHSGETAYNTYAELQSIIGETDQAVEAAQQIALLARSEEDAAHWAALAAGLVGKMGDALQPETFYEAANETFSLNEATGAYVQLIEGSGKSVDEFNEGLQACTTEAERQAYMLEYTEDILGDAATQYKKTNKEIIASNKANEKLNRNLAEVGETAEPLMTDIKELGSAFLEDMQDPLKDTVNFIRKKVLPGLTSIGDWVKSNKPIVISAVAGITATLVALKVATLASEAASKGLTIATIAQTAAQKALNAVMTAGPVGLLTTALVGATAAMAAWAIATEEAKEPVDVLTEAERDLIASADEAAASFRDQKEATQETLGGISAEMDQVQKLADELRGLADASGRVQEKDQARADFILGQLNEALGTEYQMVDGVIQQYQELKTSIDDVIQSKLANSLLEAANADYVLAIQNEADSLSALVSAEKDYQAQLAVTQEAEEKAKNARAALSEKVANAKTESDYRMLASEGQYVYNLEQNARREAEILSDKKAKYEEAAGNYGNYSATIQDFEEAQTAALQGNYDRAVELLSKKGQSFHQYSTDVDEATAAAIDALFKEAVDAGLAAERTKNNFESGVEGYTEEMVKEAEQSYEDALAAYADAYADAEGVGEDLGAGLEDGMENKRSGLVNKAKSLVSGILSAMRKEADSHSPARKTIDFGEDVGEGAEIGIENKTKDVAQAGKRQAAALLDAYRSQEVEGQATLTGIAQRRAERQTADGLTAASVNAPILGKILEAIKAGQVLLLDGDLLVGGTEGKIDNALGRRRVLVERKAI